MFHFPSHNGTHIIKKVICCFYWDTQTNEDIYLQQKKHIEKENHSYRKNNNTREKI